MFINPVVVDEMFNKLRGAGLPSPMLGLFDPDVVVPLDQLPSQVQTPDGTPFSAGRIPELIESGWFRTGDVTTESGTMPGFSLYVTGRIDLYLELEKRGYEPEELRRLARHEDMWVDEFVTVDDLEYEHDDIALLIHDRTVTVRDLESEIAHAECVLEDSRPLLEKARRDLDYLQSIGKLDALSPARRERIERAAFHVRWRDECLRLNVIEGDRAKIRAGYSPRIAFARQCWSSANGYEFETVSWHCTLFEGGSILEEIDGPGLRVPGFILGPRGLRTTDTLIPSKYEKLWREHDLDTYFTTVANVRGGRVCAHCLTPLTPPHKAEREYCSERCRGSAKQRRHRQKSPDSVHEAQVRYFSSLADPVR